MDRTVLEETQCTVPATLMSPVEVSEIAAWLYTVFMVPLSGKRNEDPNVLRMQMLEIV